MTKSIFRAGVLLSLCLSLGLWVNAQRTEIQYLSGTDKDHTVNWDFFCTKGMNSLKWSTIPVPSQWELQGFGSYNYGQKVSTYNNEQGLYKYKFNVPKAWARKKIYIVFEGSMTDTEVKLNGKSAGAKHQGSFYRFRYEVSGLLHYGNTNLLEVNVSKESSDSSVNHAERRGDYWIFGGIFRPVYLEAFPKEFIDRTAIDARADGSFAMDVYLDGISKAKEVTAQLQSLDGKPFGSPISASLVSGQEQVKVTGSFLKPALWNPESPELYEVVVSLKAGKTILHQVKQRFGFRTVEVRQNDGIYVNNRKVMFRGVCRHTSWPTSGRCSSKALSIADVNLMKDMNMNAVRMSHYPPDPHFLDVCDSLGMFVLDELAGWHAFYSTEVGKRLVKQMAERDVNHPCVVLWDNGNEGGFNKELREEYAKHDPQNRQVIEPWAKLNGMDTKHYPGYKYVQNALNTGNLIYFPTEFLHGLYDGGHGAGLDDYWELMNSKPLAAGGFLWVFADEGIVRKDLSDSVDTHGNYAPDGIVGPFREIEGSFFTIKEIWSPVHIKKIILDHSFNGMIPVANRFLYTNLSQCTFTGEWVKFSGSFPGMESKKSHFNCSSPEIAPGESGMIKIEMPANWEKYDALYLSANDPSGRHINTWSWNITRPGQMASRIVKPLQDKVSGKEDGDFVILSSGITSARFSKMTGLLISVKVGDHVIPFSNGPVVVGQSLHFKELRHFDSAGNHIVEISYNQSPGFVKWTMLGGGILQLEYQYQPAGKVDFAGITFSYPENNVKGAILLANGPYHVWKNRLKGTEFGLFQKKYNNTVTGQTWEYPEFKGYYSNFYAVQVQTKDIPFTIVSATDNLFLHLFTPQAPLFVKGGVSPPFPSGNISLLNCISAIGTKFTKPEAEGPQSQQNEYLPGDKPLYGKVFFCFGE